MNSDESVKAFKEPFLPFSVRETLLLARKAASSMFEVARIDNAEAWIKRGQAIIMALPMEAYAKACAEAGIE